LDFCVKDYFTRQRTGGASAEEAFTAEYAEIAEKTFFVFSLRSGRPRR
jgi:hypothetical protein